MLPSGNRWLARQNDQVIADYTERFNDNTITDRVRARLIDLLPGGVFNEPWMADALHLSARTLQRRLADEGTGYKLVLDEALDEARQALATQDIGEDRLSIRETSYLLGFSEPSNFSRAFKRWTGTSPARYRDEGSTARPAVSD